MLSSRQARHWRKPATRSSFSLYGISFLRSLFCFVFEVALGQESCLRPIESLISHFLILLLSP